MRALRALLRRWLGIEDLDGKTNTIAREIARLGIAEVNNDHQQKRARTGRGR